MPPEFSIRSGSVDVEQVMTQIYQRIRDKRGVDYTEEEIRQLANVKVERFLDPAQVRSDLVQHFRQAQESARTAQASPPENYAFEDHLVYGSTRGRSGRLITRIRKLLNPVLKLFINPDPIINVLHRQGAINAHNERQFDRVERVAARALNYEVMHNMVVEMTRLSIEVKNLKMRFESLSSRLDFGDQRARALESVVQYRPGSASGVSPEASGSIERAARRASRHRRRRGGEGPNPHPGTGDPSSVPSGDQTDQ